YKIKKIYIFENGITTMNFAETQDQINARASRTTHPKTLSLYMKLFSAIAENDFTIENPFFFKTKTDVVNILKQYNALNLIRSSVSCGQSRKSKPGYKHCGTCSQCLDRIYAVYSNEVEKADTPYSFNFLKEKIVDKTIRRAI